MGARRTLLMIERLVDFLDDERTAHGETLDALAILEKENGELKSRLHAQALSIAALTGHRDQLLRERSSNTSILPDMPPDVTFGSAPGAGAGACPRCTRTDLPLVYLQPTKKANGIDFDPRTPAYFCTACWAAFVHAGFRHFEETALFGVAHPAGAGTYAKRPSSDVDLSTGLQALLDQSDNPNRQIERFAADIRAAMGEHWLAGGGTAPEQVALLVKSLNACIAARSELQNTIEDLRAGMPDEDETRALFVLRALRSERYGDMETGDAPAYAETAEAFVNHLLNLLDIAEGREEEASGGD